MRWRWIVVVGLSCAACGGPSATGRTGGAGGAGGSGQSTAGGAGGQVVGNTSTGGMEAPGPTATLLGTVIDTSGAPMKDAVLALCSSACFGAATDEKGAFAYVDVPADHYKLEVRASSADPRRMGVVFFPVDLPADAKLSLPAPIALPETGTGTMLGSGKQAIVIDDELSLHVDVDQIVLPFAEKESYLAGVRVAEAYWPAHVPTDGSVLAVWALNPYAMTSMIPIGLSLTTALGLAPSTSIDVHIVGLGDAELSKVATAAVTANGDGIVTTTDEGITDISWVVLTTQP
jgi:hypothetical protein